MFDNDERQTGWVAPLARPSRSLATQTTTAVSLAEKRLQPAPSAVFRDELTGTLTLCAPSGMTDTDRAEWLKVAFATLKHLPEDLLRDACCQARKRVDHPAKIVPMIVAETEEAMKTRQFELRQAAYDGTPCLPPPVEPEPEYVTPEAAAAILEEFGLKSDHKIAEHIHRGPPKHPTRADYIALGVDPANLS